MKQNRAYYHRGFLNEGSGTAMVEASVGFANGEYVDANLMLSDCSRQINLEFSGSGKAGARKKLRKLRKIIAIMDAFEAALAAEVAKITGEEE